MLDIPRQHHPSAVDLRLLVLPTMGWATPRLLSVLSLDWYRTPIGQANMLQRKSLEPLSNSFGNVHVEADVNRYDIEPSISNKPMSEEGSLMLWMRAMACSP